MATVKILQDYGGYRSSGSESIDTSSADMVIIINNGGITAATLNGVTMSGNNRVRYLVKPPRDATATLALTTSYTVRCAIYVLRLGGPIVDEDYFYSATVGNAITNTVTIGSGDNGMAFYLVAGAGGGTYMTITASGWSTDYSLDGADGRKIYRMAHKATDGSDQSVAVQSNQSNGEIYILVVSVSFKRRAGNMVIL